MTKMNMRFSPNLNCIVGGRGTGKSTIVDAINYGVCNEHDLSKCRLLEKTLTKDAKISTYFNFGSNKPYVIKASRKGKQIVTDVEDNNGSVENPPEFKIDFYGQKEIFNLIDEDDNIANQTMSPLVKMIDDKVSADMYSYSDEIDSAILNMQKYSDEFKSNRKKIKELPTIKAEIEKADTILKKFKASGIEESRKDFENIDNKIKNVEKSFASELNAVTVAVASFEEQNRGLDNQMEALDISVENAIELEVIEKLKSINQSLIEILNHKKESVETLKREYEISTTYEKREEIHRKYLNALDEVKNTGGEDINAIQDQLQKNKKRYDDLMSLQNEQGNIEKKIEESIDNFIDKRIELSKKRQAVIDNLKLENISIKVIPLRYFQVVFDSQTNDRHFSNCHYTSLSD